MESSLRELESGLASVLRTIASCVADSQDVLRNQAGSAGLVAGGQNTFGDKQLQLDVEVDNLIFAHLGACSACCAASSEERPEIRQLCSSGTPPGQQYTVVFDPLDGSSIVDANFSVGAIFGVWPGNGVVGRTGREQAAAAYACYGPRTLLVWARPVAGISGQKMVEQWLLLADGSWRALPLPPATPSLGPVPLSLVSSPISQVPGFVAGPDTQGSAATDPSPAAGGRGEQEPCVSIIAPSKPIFSPANMRCAADNVDYAALINGWVRQALTLRYTGGMVPDIHHLLAKGGGVFVSPASTRAPAKLRVVYECAPLALIVEAAGGASHDGHGSMLDRVIGSTSDRAPICLGSTLLVAESVPAMCWGQEKKAGEMQ